MAATKRKFRRADVIKGAVFLAFIAGAIVLIRFSPAGSYFSAEKLDSLVDRAGLLAPLVFMVFYAAGVCLFVPGTLLTAIGAAVFGPYRGFLFVWFGAMLGAAASFVIARYLGRDFAANLIGGRLQKYDEAIGRNGFATVLYLRLVYFPFTLLNFGMGLTRVRFADYMLGTGLGILVGTFVFTFLIGTLREIAATGRWEMLASWKPALAAALFAGSLFIPKLVKKLRGETAGNS